VLPCMLIPEAHSNSCRPAGSRINANWAMSVVPESVARTSVVNPCAVGVGGDVGFCAQGGCKLTACPES